MELMASEWWWATESMQERRRVVRSAPDRWAWGGHSHLHGYGEIGPGEVGHGHADRGINEWMLEWGGGQSRGRGREERGWCQLKTKPVMLRLSLALLVLHDSCEPHSCDQTIMFLHFQFGSSIPHERRREVMKGSHWFTSSRNCDCTNFKEVVENSFLGLN
jgi:hypothetical protein